MKSDFFMVPTQNSSLGVTISSNLMMNGSKRNVRIAHIHEIDVLISIIQVLNETIDLSTVEEYDHTDTKWLYLEPFIEGDSSFSSIIQKLPNGGTKILGTIHLPKYQTTILRAIKHSINTRKKEGK